ncbi:MAG: hypothetical protein E6R08_00655 [Nevskiaceae bacterium]|nr:MAG: hypothetical protein E6R08_00655 [Nevskiaceae bacterium]
MTIQFTLQESTAAEVALDMGNATAVALLQAVGLPAAEPRGELDVENFGPVIERCLRLTNGQGVDRYTVEPSFQPGEMRRGDSSGNVVPLQRGCDFIDMGVDEDKLRRRAGELLALLRQGREAGVGIRWH